MSTCGKVFGREELKITTRFASDHDFFIFTDEIYEHFIDDGDVARAAVLAVKHPGYGRQIFNVSDGRFHALKEIIVAICQALGRNPPRLSLPVGPARITAGLMEDTFRLVGQKSPIRRDTIEKYTKDIAVDSTRIQKELGFQPKYDLLIGWQETIQQMQELNIKG